MPQNDHDDAFTGESGYTDNVDEVPSADTGFNMDPNENDANGDPNVATTALTALTADDARCERLQARAWTSSTTRMGRWART